MYVIGGQYNELQIYDRISGTDMTFRYRMPTTKEVVQYGSDTISLKRNRTRFQYAQARIKWGREILMGIRCGDFGLPADDFSRVCHSGAITEKWEAFRDKAASGETVYRLADGKRVPNHEPWMPVEHVPGGHEADFVPMQLTDFDVIPISSDPVSPFYVETWKNIICDQRPDLVSLLAATIFDQSAETEALD